MIVGAEELLRQACSCFSLEPKAESFVSLCRVISAFPFHGVVLLLVLRAEGASLPRSVLCQALGRTECGFICEVPCRTSTGSSFL